MPEGAAEAEADDRTWTVFIAAKASASIAVLRAPSPQVGAPEFAARSSLRDSFCQVSR